MNHPTASVFPNYFGVPEGTVFEGVVSRGGAFVASAGIESNGFALDVAVLGGVGWLGGTTPGLPDCDVPGMVAGALPG